MKEIKTVSVIGMGAIGSAYAAQLATALPGGAVRVIAGGERAERYRRQGHAVNGSTCFFTVTEPHEQVEPADLLLFAVKHHQLEQAIADARNHVGENTVILSMINGISSEEIIGKAYGEEKLLYAISMSNAVRENGNTLHQSKVTIYFGERRNPPGNLSERVQAVRALFDKAGVEYKIPEDMLHSLWWKFMFNTGINQASAVLRAPHRFFSLSEKAYGLMLDAIHEVMALSKAAGVNLTHQDLQLWLDKVPNLNPDGKTSMLQDIEAGRKSEVEIFGGTVAELGRRYGIPTPVNDMLYQIISAIDQMNGY